MVRTEEERIESLRNVSESLTLALEVSETIFGLLLLSVANYIKSQKQ